MRNNLLFPPKNTSKLVTLSKQKIVTVNTLHINRKRVRLLQNSKWWTTHPRSLFFKSHRNLTSEAMRARHTRIISLKGRFLPDLTPPPPAALAECDNDAT